METINKYESVFLEGTKDESGITLNRYFDIINNKLVPFAVNPNYLDAFHTLSVIQAQDAKNFPNELKTWAWTVSSTDNWNEQSSNIISTERTNSSIIQFIDVSKSATQANTLFGQLLDGLYLGCPLVGDQVLFSFTQEKHNLGILCRKNILDITSGTIKINNQQYSIPVYQYSPNRALINHYPKCMLVDTVDLGVPATYVLRPEKNILNALYIAIFMAFACHKYQKTDIYQSYDNWPELDSTFNEAIVKQYKTNVLFNLKRIINCSTTKTKQLLDLFINFVQPFFPEPLTQDMITSPDVYTKLISSLKDIYSSSEKLNKFLHGILLINSNIINDLTQDESLISSSPTKSTSLSPNSGISSSSSSTYGSGHSSSSGSYSNTYANAASDDLAATYQKDRTLYSYNNSSEDKSTTTQSSSVNSATSGYAEPYQHENNGQAAAVESSTSNQEPFNEDSITQDEGPINNSQASGHDDIRESTAATEQSSDNKPTDTNSSLDSAVLTNSNSDVNAPAQKGSTIQNSTPTANNSLSSIPNDGASIEKVPSRDAQLSNQEEISTQEPTASSPNSTSLSASKNTIESASKSENENDSLDDTKIVKSKARTILRLRPKEGKESKESDTEKTAYQSLAINYVSHDINRTAEHSLRAVCANLNGSFASENIISPLLSQMLTCYLTVMHHYRIPLLLLGPYKDHIVSSFTYGAYQQGYNQILLSDSFKSMEFEQALKNCRRFAVVDNLFSPGYSDNVMPLSKEHSELGIYLSYPFYSDIQLQPKSIFAYAMPLISEFFIVNDLVTRYPCYQGSTMYFSTKELVSSATLNDACMADYSKLGLSQLVLNRTKYILGATTELMHYSLNNNIFEPTDTEYTSDSLMANISLLFGLAPLSLCLGRSELLNEALENDLIFTEIRENLKPFCS